MRILIVVIDFPALSETYVLDQITGLIDRGFDVDILASKMRDEATIHPDVEDYSLLNRAYYIDNSPPSGSRIARWTLIFARLVRRGRFRLMREAAVAGLRRAFGLPVLIGALQLVAYAHTLERLPTPDMVVCHFGPTGDLMVRLRRATKAKWPILTFFHGYDLSLLLQKNGPGIYRRLFREGDFFLPVSRFFQKRLVSIGAAPDRMAVHRMGVKVQPHLRTSKHASARAQNEFSFLSIGRLVEKKGLEFAIRAVARCREVNPELKMTLSIVGDGPLHNHLRDTVDSLGLGNLVQLLGSMHREQVVDKLQTANAFLLPSVTTETGDIEGIPVSISEAMAMGLPVISTYHSGIPEIIEHEINGFLVPERDVDALADAMCRIVRDRSLADRMGRAGREKVERELDLDRWNDLLSDRIRDLGRVLQAAE
jgi:colanic acid/amylovoran biosynthesis glycosyltransferase